VFDTDILSIVQLEAGPAFEAIETRMLALGETFYTSIVRVEEQMRGWLAAVAKARTVEAEVSAYRRLLRMIEYFRDRPILPFDAAAASRVRQLRAMKLRLGTMDLKIAAAAMEHDALLVSRNLVDFRQVPGLRVEDWTT
jgi:tRNA(fMet)-specific endonuclease VapC